MGWITRANDARRQAAAGRHEVAARQAAARQLDEDWERALAGHDAEMERYPDAEVNAIERRDTLSPDYAAPWHERTASPDAEIDRLAELYPETTDPERQQAAREADGNAPPAPEMGEDYYTQPAGSDRHRQAYAEYTEATGGPRDGWTTEQEYAADNWAELEYDRQQDQQDAAHLSADREREPGAWLLDIGEETEEPDAHGYQAERDLEAGS